LNVRIAFGVVALALAAVLLTAGREGSLSADKGAEVRPSASKVSVLVELFTSEGCSSCPAADELLTRLDQTQPIAGAEVIALSEHVDYWNRLGWADPYSSAVFSARQTDYARVFDIDGIYTPQMIVDGRAQFVGSNASRAREAIGDASRDLKAEVKVSVASDDTRKGSVTLDVSIANIPQVTTDVADAFLAVAESGLRSSVSRGENAGRRLSHTGVVRKLISIGKIDSQQFEARAVESIEKSWNRGLLKAVVFVQERKSRRVLGAASVPLGM
jgi:hypothetical protein